MDGKGYCMKKKEDSFGVPEPCRACKAEGGLVNRLGGPTPIQQPQANLGGQAYYYDGSSATRAGGAQGLAPLPPPRAHLSSSYRNERHGQVQMSSRYDTRTQQPQVHQAPARRPSKYENPRQPPPRPSRSTKYAAEPDNRARKQSEEYARKTIREAGKVSRETRRKDKVDDIRARAIAKARETKRHAEPSSTRQGSSNTNSAYPAPLNLSKHRHAATPAVPHDAVYPDIRHHPAMESDVQFAVHHEAFTVGTHYDEETRRFQDSAVRWGAASHPDRYRMEHPIRDARRYATRAEVDRIYQQPYAVPRGGYDADVNGVSPLTYSPPESQVSALNVTQKLPYTHRRR